MEKETKKGGKFAEFIKTHKVLSIVLACVIVAVIASAIVCFAIFGKDIVNAITSAGDNSDKEAATYTVTIKSQGGMALTGIDVYVYDNDKLENIETYAKTNDQGIVTFNIPESDDYAVVLASVPEGYQTESVYKFTDKVLNITPTTALITDKSLSDAQSLTVGSVMYDFSVVDSMGNEIKFSEVLAEKKVAVLNFWFSTCSPCLSEFPIIDEVYQEYEDEVALLALNPHPTDNAESVRAFHQQNPYSFTMAACPNAWSGVFGVTGYPTTVFVDRYGVICLVETGSLPSRRPLVSAIEHFIAEDYQQKLFTGIDELMTQIKPIYETPTSEEIGAIINKGDIQVTYRPDTEDDDAEFFWPYIKTEKLGNECIYASNKGYEDTSAVMYADVTLKKGQAIGFDYLVSSERYSDILYVFVDGVDIFQISGVDENEVWKSCYPLVAQEDGTYTVQFIFVKDSSTSEGDDTVYIDNMRVIDASEIDVETYLPRYAATTKDDGDTYSYVDIVFNEADGYYHVGTANGPLLLADLMYRTHFAPDNSIQNIVSEGEADKDGISLYNKKADGGAGMVQYFSYASNSAINGLCPVNEELCTMLKQVAEVAGFDSEDANEWLRICKYYEAFGPGATQLENPIKGVSLDSPLTATLGKDIATNYFYYNRAIHPRGMYAEFIPSQSGVYRFTSKSDYADGIDAWIFDENGNNIYTYEHDERMYADLINCSIVYYMEAGKAYYINMAFWDIYATGYIYYDVEFLGTSIELFRLASPGYFTYDSNAEGDEIYAVIAGGITPVLKDDGYYHEETDGSIIYADFTGTTGVFGQSITQMIEIGGFDFSKSETDGEILAYLNQNDGDVEKTKEYLETLWGDDYDANAELYQLDDIFEGIYHGDGEDYTEEMRSYVSKVNTSGTELDGCVPVDERLAELLQLLMEKYTFQNVDHSWTKLCYYYDYLGA